MTALLHTRRGCENHDGKEQDAHHRSAGSFAVQMSGVPKLWNWLFSLPLGGAASAVADKASRETATRMRFSATSYGLGSNVVPTGSV